MRRRSVPLAICYDFDGTLAPGNMQEHAFIPKVGMKARRFWSEVSELCKTHDADNILVYMGLMIEKANSTHVPVRKKDFREHGKGLKLFDGVVEWFDRINKFGSASGVDVEHYLISSGIREIVEGTSIGRKFKKIFASSFWYDHNGVAKWPGLALNYTTKTQYLFRINKGCLSIFDHTKINEYIPKEERPVPFENMVFIGDGETDIPCFRLVKDQGGHSIAVYRPSTKGAKKRSEKLIADGRVSYAAPADFCDGRPLDRIIKMVIEKVAIDNQVRLLKRIN